VKISAEGKIKTKPHLSMLALISFIASFMVARLFTTFNPDTVLISGDFHIHHFWYGLALLAIGGWLGITVENDQVNRLAAILFGAGGGLIGDEFGLLLTLEDYWTGITYTFVIIFVTFASMFILIKTYSSIIRREFAEFLSSNASLYLGVFLAAVSVAFSMETSNVIITTVSILLTIIAVIIVLAYLIQRLRRDRR
jgi:hypothetical protein